jgi:hypothetical protein
MILNAQLNQRKELNSPIKTMQRPCYGTVGVTQCAKKKKERKIDDGKARSTHHHEYVQEASCQVNIGDANGVANRKLSKTNAK